MKKTLLLLYAVSILASCNGGFEFVQISDVQIGFNDPAPYNCSVDHFARVIEEINDLDPAFVINTGDMVQSPGNELQNALYDSLAVTLKAPMWVIPGNHDIRNKPLSRERYMQKVGYCNFSFVKRGCAFIGIDSNCIKYADIKAGSAGPAEAGKSGKVALAGNAEAGMTDAQRAEEQLVWLEEQLKAAGRCRYIFVFSHCPIFTVDPQEADGHNNYPLSGRQAYLDLLQRYNVTAVFSGHSHYSMETMYENTKMYVSGSVARSDVEDGSLDCGYYRVRVPRSKRKNIEVEYVPFMEKWMEEQEAQIQAWEVGKVVIEEAFNAIGMENCLQIQNISDSLMTVMREGGSWKENTPEFLRDELCYIRIPHRNETGRVQLGEMVLNRRIAQDVIEIFSELFRQNYKIEYLALVDKFNADDDVSCYHNNTASFNFRFMTNSTTRISKHGYGLAIDLNPFYNPYVKGESIVPEGSEAYAFDRGPHVPYCLYDGDLAVKLFKQHGFTWGGDWHSLKDYMHFEK